MKKAFVICVCIFTFLLSIGLSSAVGFYSAARYYSKRELLHSEVLPETIPAETQSLQAQFEHQQNNTVVDIAQMCTKSVVNITIKEVTKGYTGGSAYSEKIISHGTGVIVREDGYIVTCHHVIDGADTIVVTLDDKTEYTAELIGFDERFDLAVIRVNASDMPAAQFGDSDAVNAGEGVVIIGNPLGEFGSSVSAGILSAPTRELTIAGTPLRLMQTDAAVNPGNSGGGMFNMQGQFIGIVNAKISASGIEGIGFAIPLNTVREKVDSIITTGNTGKKAVLGVSTKTAICYIDGKNVSCLEIASVRDGSAADKAGLTVGDYLLRVDNKPLESNDDLTLNIKYHSSGDLVEFEVYRDGETLLIPVTLGE